jgi:hypothetical protein
VPPDFLPAGAAALGRQSLRHGGFRKGTKVKTRMRFVWTLVAFAALAAQPVAAQSRYDPPPTTTSKTYTRGGPAPVIGAGLPVIIVAGAALAGYRLWRRRGRSTDNS